MMQRLVVQLLLALLILATWGCRERPSEATAISPAPPVEREEAAIPITPPVVPVPTLNPHAIPPEAPGYTSFVPSPESRVVYVSSSLGSDDNDGLSEERPVASVQKGAELVRDGFHDFLLLRRGDAFDAPELKSFKSGKGASHPLVISSYGSSTSRPVLNFRKPVINHNGKKGDHLALIGLAFVSVTQVPGHPDFTGEGGLALRFVGGGDSLLIEDCLFRHGEIVIQSYAGHRYANVAFRHNVVERSYHKGTCEAPRQHRPSGMYSSGVEGFVIENNLFDHNGHSRDLVETACATMYNHNLYLNATNLIVRNNLIFRASSIGIKMRSDKPGAASNLLFEENLFVDGEVGLSIGGNKKEPSRFRNVVVRGNVFSEVGVGNPTERRLSWLIDLEDNENTLIEDNAFLHQPSFSNAFGIRLGGSQSDVTIRGNSFLGLAADSIRLVVGAGADPDTSPSWKAVTISDNRFASQHSKACFVRLTGAATAPSTEFRNNHYADGTEKLPFCIEKERLDGSAWASRSGEIGGKTWAAELPSPPRTVSTYAKTLGAPESMEGFLSLARSQSRFSHRSDVSARAVIRYIKAGKP